MNRTNTIRMIAIAAMTAASGAVFFAASASAATLVGTSCEGNWMNAVQALEPGQPAGACQKKVYRKIKRLPRPQIEVPPEVVAAMVIDDEGGDGHGGSKSRGRGGRGQR